jgi:hypothetical protein
MDGNRAMLLEDVAWSGPAAASRYEVSAVLFGLQVLERAPPWFSESVMFAHLDFAKSAGNSGRQERYGWPVTRGDSSLHLGRHRRGPSPVHAKSIGLDPVAPLFPGTYAGINTCGNRFQGDRYEGGEVLRFGAGAGLARQFS